MVLYCQASYTITVIFNFKKPVGLFFLEINECFYYVGLTGLRYFLRLFHSRKENKNRILRNFCMFFYN